MMRFFSTFQMTWFAFKCTVKSEWRTTDSPLVLERRICQTKFRLKIDVQNEVSYTWLEVDTGQVGAYSQCHFKMKSRSNLRILCCQLNIFRVYPYLVFHLTIFFLIGCKHTTPMTFAYVLFGIPNNMNWPTDHPWSKENMLN